MARKAESKKREAGRVKPKAESKRQGAGGGGREAGREKPKAESKKRRAESGKREAEGPESLRDLIVEWPEEWSPWTDPRAIVVQDNTMRLDPA
jgi:hypothetical protein